MTDREKLIELFDHFGIKDWKEQEYMVDHLIANGVTVQRWIPVSERLPELDADKVDDRGREKSIRVLCACKQKSGKGFVKEGYYVLWDGDRVYWRIPGSIDSVTHWMPLPEPPKEVE